MLSSPYPVPPLWAWTLVMMLGALQGLGAGLWVIVSPPVSYEGIGATLTMVWGVLIAVGSALVLLGHAVRVHQIEVPGLAFALGGMAIYVYLSWEQTLGTAPGSGPRALFLGQLACFYLARLLLLLHIDFKARARKSREVSADG